LHAISQGLHAGVSRDLRVDTNTAGVAIDSRLMTTAEQQQQLMQFMQAVQMELTSLNKRVEGLSPSKTPSPMAISSPSFMQDTLKVDNEDSGFISPLSSVAPSPVKVLPSPPWTPHLPEEDYEAPVHWRLDQMETESKQVANHRPKSAGEVVSAVGAEWDSFDIGYDSDEQQDRHAAGGLGHVVRQPELSGPPELPALSASGQEHSAGGTGVEQREEGWEEKWEDHPALHEDEILRLLQQQAQSYREELRQLGVE